MRAALLALASASVFALQPNAATAQSASDHVTDGETLGEIVVTARRRVENLQEVPQTVNAITSDTLQKLTLTQFKDIQSVAPGLTMQQSNTAFDASASLRGVTNSAFSSPYPSVAIYVNDAPAIATETFQSLYDIAQIEVLKGPQGTTRGISAPSGAITIATRKPNLSEMGGYASTILTDLQGRNAQGAINIPIVEDVLAVRVAGVIDQNDFDGVRSIHSRLRPQQKISSERLTVSFEPNDQLNATVTYQHLDRKQSGFQPVTGPGAGTAIDPPLSARQRVAVGDRPQTFNGHFDSVIAQLDYRALGHNLSYVGSYRHFKIKQSGEQDAGDILPGVDYFQGSYTTSEITTHEIRLSSDSAPGRLLDYTLGAFYSWNFADTTLTQPASFQSGAFGSPAATPSTAAFNPKFQIPLVIAGPGAGQETSIFGNVTFHLGAKTELSAGVRHIISLNNSNLKIALGDGVTAAPAALFGGQCAASTYPGFCDLTIPTGGTVVADSSFRTSERPTIYNVSLSHRLTDDLLVYANTGTSYRGPASSTGVQGALANNPDPDLNKLTFRPSEKSRSYEAGVKWTMLDGRGRINASVYRQKYRNLGIFVPGIDYFNTTVGQVSNANFTTSVDAVVQGFDIDTAWQITDRWNVAGQLSYSHNQIEGSLVPCNAPGAVLSPTNLISLCPGGSGSRLPLWNLTLQSEYLHPVSAGVDGFVRGLLNYYPENKYVSPTFAADPYSLINLYAGLRSRDGGWEISAFARNVLNTNNELDRGQQPLTVSTLGSFPSLNRSSGYFTTQLTPRREVGVSLRYAWGTR